MHLTSILKSIGIAIMTFALLAGSAGPASAKKGGKGIKGGQQAATTPEIDPGTASTAVALLAGGLAVLRHRRRNR